MILRDVYCVECGLVTCDVVFESADHRSCSMVCRDCDSETEHISVCNGGTRARYRFNDWPTDPEFYRGQIKVGPVEAVDSEGEPVRRYHSGTREVGDRMDSDKRYKNGLSIRETKRDKLKHASRRQRGRLPLVFDQGAKSGG